MKAIHKIQWLLKRQGTEPDWTWWLQVVIPAFFVGSIVGLLLWVGSQL